MFQIIRKMFQNFNFALERHHILRVLEYTKGNKAEAARLLGIGIATLYRKLESYGMKP